QRREQLRLRAGQERLQPQRLDLVEQGGAAAGVEVGGGLVQQQDRRGGLIGQPGDLGEDQVQNQRLLLARRAFGGGPVLLAVQGGQVGAVRPEQRPPGGGVAGAAARHTLADGGGDGLGPRVGGGHGLGFSGQS